MKEIVENNKLIAEFMGWKKHPIEDKSYYTPHTQWKFEDALFGGYPEKQWESSKVFKEDELMFEESWDWLMPVILKCKEEMNYNENNDYHHIEDTLLSYLSIDETYLAVVLFIEKHNENNKN